MKNAQMIHFIPAIEKLFNKMADSFIQQFPLSCLPDLKDYVESNNLQNCPKFMEYIRLEYFLQLQYIPESHYIILTNNHGENVLGAIVRSVHDDKFPVGTLLYVHDKNYIIREKSYGNIFDSIETNESITWKGIG